MRTCSAPSLAGVAPMRRRLVMALAAAPMLPLAGAGLMVPMALRAQAETSSVRRLLMGTWVDIVVADGRGRDATVAIEAAFDEMARLAGMMSRFVPDSRLTELNRAAGRCAVELPPEMMAVLRSARDLARRSAGAFDITVGGLTAGDGASGTLDIPDDNTVRRALIHVNASHLKLDDRQRTAYIDDPLTQLDLGGIAKLPILEAGMNVLAARGVRGAMINGGGDVLAGARPDGRPWRIGVRDPLRPERLLAVLPLHSGVVASSGDYERFVLHEGRRYHHILDPRTGRPTQGVHGVTLVAERVAEVNGLGTAAMVAGPLRGPAWLQRCGVREALLVAADGRIRTSAALARRLVPPPGAPGVPDRA